MMRGIRNKHHRHPRLVRGSGSASARLIDSYDGLTAFRIPAQGGDDGFIGRI